MNVMVFQVEVSSGGRTECSVSVFYKDQLGSLLGIELVLPSGQVDPEFLLQKIEYTSRLDPSRVKARGLQPEQAKSYLDDLQRVAQAASGEGSRVEWSLQMSGSAD